MTECSNCGHDPDRALCPDCGFLPSGENGSPDARRTRCWTCEFPDEDKSRAVGNYVMKGGQYCDGEKRILALPGNHPDAHPSSEAEANRMMDKHGIDKETGFWQNEKRKEAAMRVAKRNAPEKRKETSKRTH